ncbi:menaquinone-dependent protoporphyrinogen oxidase [Cohaesibacter sp. ES.047]|uniref:menaquinone-dependent protoporphyrinogen IX dehydrogenase n=1 Tax=Cohaesibacter sp. ES.047 TaxID=1798205 RepID=UPI000BB8FA0B|nr:menaquinone-dependent protoporphyrinogen IX dehydrogenase [Cohaesibacter sp. ES.047]SNY91108.1 menaquinone-dependent protoporphyrinogen oxidase [Cohaesibacter sp. ES.047]
MSLIAIYFASQDGQAAKVAAFIGEQIEQTGPCVTVSDLNAGTPSDITLDRADVVVVVAAIRYGRHLKPAERFLSYHEAALSQKKLVLISVNLTARKPEKRSIERSIYLQKWVARYPTLSPVLVRAVAGRLDYPRYSRFDRFMIRLIMSITKGPTDPTSTIEFTDWDEVGELASEIAAI